MISSVWTWRCAADKVQNVRGCRRAGVNSVSPLQRMPHKKLVLDPHPSRIQDRTHPGLLLQNPPQDRPWIPREAHQGRTAWHAAASCQSCAGNRTASRNDTVLGET